MQNGERLSGKIIFSLFPLSRCTENSNLANSLEALSVSMRIISNLCVCVYVGVCYSVLYSWTVKLSLYSSNVSSINQLCNKIKKIKKIKKNSFLVGHRHVQIIGNAERTNQSSRSLHLLHKRIYR